MRAKLHVRRRRSPFTTLMLLYAIMHVFVGSVLTLADALSPKKIGRRELSMSRRPYLEIFYITEYIASICGLLILTILSCEGERKDRSKKNDSSEKSEMVSRIEKHPEEVKTRGKFLFFGPIFVHSRKSTQESHQPSTFTNYVKSDEVHSAQPHHENLIPNTVSLLHTNSVIESDPLHYAVEHHPASATVEDRNREWDDCHKGSTFVLDREENLSSMSEDHRQASSPRAFFSEQTHHVDDVSSLGRSKISSHFKLQRVFRDREGVNLYLRLGTVAFGFGVMIYDGFSLSDHLGGSSNHCRSIRWLTKTLLHFIFIFIQTFYLFKYHRIVYNWHSSIVKFILIHLTTTNLLQWLKTVVFAVGDQLISESKSQNITAWILNVYNFSTPQGSVKEPNKNLIDPAPLHGLTGSIHKDGETSCTGFSEHLKPFLFPCSVEYSLITMAICYKLYQKEGGAYHQYLNTRQAQSRASSVTCLSAASGLTSAQCPASATDTKSQSKSHLHEVDLQQHYRLYSKCHHANRGLFIGLLVVLMTMVGMGLFFYFHREEKQKFMAITIYQATEIALQVLSCLACIVGFVKQISLSFRNLSEGEAFDVNLLLLGFCGMFSYNMFLMLPALINWKNGSITEHLYVVKSGMEIIQTLLQVFFIMEASHRCAGTIENIRDKPGRTWVTFLLVCNLSMWIVNTFEVKVVDQHHHLHRSFYSDLSWNIVTFISIPMIIFYRFHSTVCLSDIWIKCYRPSFY